MIGVFHLRLPIASAHHRADFWDRTFDVLHIVMETLPLDIVVVSLAICYRCVIHTYIHLCLGTSYLDIFVMSIRYRQMHDKRCVVESEVLPGKMRIISCNLFSTENIYLIIWKTLLWMHVELHPLFHAGFMFKRSCSYAQIHLLQCSFLQPCFHTTTYCFV